jgi:sugar phosphate isomerase/epimerase
LAEIADHNLATEISIEYKPNEPRSFSLMPDIGTTLLAISQIGRNNNGVTLDFAHMLFADEMPAFCCSSHGAQCKAFRGSPQRWLWQA